MILILAYDYDPHISGELNPLYKTSNHAFEHCSFINAAFGGTPASQLFTNFEPSQ